jgi:hypothetical protein
MDMGDPEPALEFLRHLAKPVKCGYIARKKALHSASHLTHFVKETI